MSSQARESRPRRPGHEKTSVSQETLHMFGVVLKAAFRMHCTGETVAGKTAWQLVHDVQLKLEDLSQCPASPVSDERLAAYVETELATPALKLADVA
jgi:hypothetical protein